MAQCVVDFLEAIQIQIQHGERPRGALRGREGLSQVIAEGHAVGKTGEYVGARELRDPRLGGLALADIDQDAFDFQQPVCFIANRCVAVLEPAHGAVAGQQPQLHARGRRIPLQQMLHGQIVARPIIRVDQ